MEKAPFCLANGSTPLSLSDEVVLPDVATPISVPVIDMNEPHVSLVKKISGACEEHGLFQIINHGVPKELCGRMVSAACDFFKLPPQERSQYLITDDETKPLRVFNHRLEVDDHKSVAMWSETLAHPWHPVDDFAHLLPRNPPDYRELASEYAKEIGWLMRQILSLISQGLGLKNDSLQTRLGDKPRLVSEVNYYPPCPQPELTLGLPPQKDFNALTILMQSRGVNGLQVMKDGKWIAVDPVPNAFVVSVGDQIQVLSNGRYKSVQHRTVTDKDLERVSIAMFYGPNNDINIGPIEDLIDAEFLEEIHKKAQCGE